MSVIDVEFHDDVFAVVDRHDLISPLPGKENRPRHFVAMAALRARQPRDMTIDAAKRTMVGGQTFVEMLDEAQCFDLRLAERGFVVLVVG